MADSHIKSNLIAKDGDESIKGFVLIQGGTMKCATLNATVIAAGAALTAGTTITAGTYAKSGTYTEATTYIKAGTNVQATTYVKIGTKKYLFAGSGTTSALVVAAATALAATPIKGSLYLGAGVIWKFDADTTATKMT